MADSLLEMADRKSKSSLHSCSIRKTLPRLLSQGQKSFSDISRMMFSRQAQTWSTAKKHRSVDMAARDFLEQNGLADLIKPVVEENKFETVTDLQLLASNPSFLDSIKIPLCWQIKFASAIKKLEK